MHTVKWKGVIGGYLIELRYGKIWFKMPVGRGIPGFINAAIRSNEVVISIGRVDPHGVVVDVLAFLTQYPEIFTAIGADHHVRVHGIELIDVFWIGKYF